MFFIFSLNSPNTPYILFYRRISNASSTASSSTACPQPVINEDTSLNFDELPSLLKTFIMEDNEAYKKEARKFSFHPIKTMPKTNGWNDDDPPPPSSCGSNLNLQTNRFIC